MEHDEMLSLCDEMIVDFAGDFTVIEKLVGARILMWHVERMTRDERAVFMSRLRPAIPNRGRRKSDG